MTDVSDDGSYLVRAHMIESKSKYRVNLFKWNKKNYKKEDSFILEEVVSKEHPDMTIGLASQVHVNDKGDIVFLFNNIFDFTSYLAVFEKKQGLKKIVLGSDLGYEKDVNGCTENNPWICWNSPVSFKNNFFSLYAHDGHLIKLDVDSGEYEKTKSNWCPK